jgi:hypothetical protein
MALTQGISTNCHARQYKGRCCQPHRAQCVPHPYRQKILVSPVDQVIVVRLTAKKLAKGESFRWSGE